MKTQLVCAKCKGQWNIEFSPADCPKCGQVSFAIVAEVVPVIPQDSPIQVDPVTEVQP